MVLILSRNATSIHSLLVDGASPAYQCTFACTLHLHTRPLSVGRRQEPRAQTPSSSTVDEYFLPSSLSLSLQGFPPSDKDDPLSSPSSWTDERRERGRWAIKRDRDNAQTHAAISTLSGRIPFAFSPKTTTREIRKRPRPFLVDSNWLRRDEEINQMEFRSVPSRLGRKRRKGRDCKPGEIEGCAISWRKKFCSRL